MSDGISFFYLIENEGERTKVCGGYKKKKNTLVEVLK